MGRKKGICTIGPRGINFRSRVEAKWATFFDLLGLDWSYEPYDLEGYIPDFILVFDKMELLVEVKYELIYENLDVHRDKIIQSGWEKSFLIVGCEPWIIEYPDNNERKITKINNENSYVNPGILYVANKDGWEYTCPYFVEENNNILIKYFQEETKDMKNGNSDFIYKKWIEATNKCQWKKKKYKKYKKKEKNIFPKMSK